MSYTQMANSIFIQPCPIEAVVSLHSAQPEDECLNRGGFVLYFQSGKGHVLFEGSGFTGEDYMPGRADLAREYDFSKAVMKPDVIKFNVSVLMSQAFNETSVVHIVEENGGVTEYAVLRRGPKIELRELAAA